MSSTYSASTYQNQPVAGALFVLGSSLTFAILGAMVKVVSCSLNNVMVVFFRNLCALLFILPWVWYRRPPGGVKTACLQILLIRSVAGLAAMYCFFYIGLLAAVGQFLLTKGYGLAPAAQVGPFTYMNILFAVLFGWLFWEELLDAWTWIGAFLICTAGVVAAQRTTSHALLGASARTAPFVDEGVHPKDH